MTASTELMINPEITNNELNKMDRQLNKHFKKTSEMAERLFQKSFREAAQKGVTQGLKGAARFAGKGLAFGGRKAGGAIGSFGKFAAGSLIGAGIDLFRGAEETSEHINDIIERVRIVDRQAGAVGIKSGELERLRLILTSTGIEEGEVQPTITAFARMLADARTGKDATLSQFTKYGTLEEAMQHFFDTVAKQDPSQRIGTLSTVFDETAAQNIGNLIGVNFDEALKKAGISVSSGELQRIIERANLAAQEKSRQEARQELANLRQAGLVTPETVKIQENMMNEQRLMLNQAIKSFDVSAQANIEINKLISDARQLAIENLPIIKEGLTAAITSLQEIQKYTSNLGENLHVQIKSGINELKEQINQSLPSFFRR